MTTNRQRMGQELSAMVDSIFREALRQDIRWPELAKASKLHISTVYRLAEIRTMYPRYQTVSRMARAVGMHLELRHTLQLRRRA